MHLTKLFLNENLQAVCIPTEIAYEDANIALEIERIGDELRIRPVRRPLSGIEKICQLPIGFHG